MPKNSRKHVALGTLTDRTGFHLRVAQILLFKNFAAKLGELGVTPAIFSVLEVLKANPGITQIRLAKAIHLDHSSMVPLLDKLGQRGLLIRETSTSDRRKKLVVLTAAGEELHALAFAKVGEHEEVIKSILTERERTELHRLLVKLSLGLTMAEGQPLSDEAAPPQRPVRSLATAPEARRSGRAPSPRRRS